MGSVNIRDSRTDRPTHLKYNTHVSSAAPLFIEFQHRRGPKKPRDRSVLVNYKAIIALLASQSDAVSIEKVRTDTKLVDLARRSLRSIVETTLEATVARIQKMISSYKRNEIVEATVAWLLPGLLPPSDGSRDHVAEASEIDDEDLSELKPTDAATSPESLEQTAEEVAAEGYFDPSELRDERDRVRREIVQRRGQPKFREMLISAYGGCCAVTGCDAIDALEAAHITGYVGPKSNEVSNGLLLRADIHTLFDLDLLRVDPDSLEVVLALKLATLTK